jgi:hypothetical protein
MNAERATRFHTDSGYRSQCLSRTAIATVQMVSGNTATRSMLPMPKPRSTWARNSAVPARPVRPSARLTWRIGPYPPAGERQQLHRSCGDTATKRRPGELLASPTGGPTLVRVVLVLLAEGHSNAAIAAKLYVTEVHNGRKPLIVASVGAAAVG